MCIILPYPDATSSRQIEIQLPSHPNNRPNLVITPPAPPARLLLPLSLPSILAFLLQSIHNYYSSWLQTRRHCRRGDDDELLLMAAQVQVASVSVSVHCAGGCRATRSDSDDASRLFSLSLAFFLEVFGLPALSLFGPNETRNSEPTRSPRSPPPVLPASFSSLRAAQSKREIACRLPLRFGTGWGSTG